MSKKKILKVLFIVLPLLILLVFFGELRNKPVIEEISAGKYNSRCNEGFIAMDLNNTEYKLAAIEIYSDSSIEFDSNKFITFNFSDKALNVSKTDILPCYNEIDKKYIYSITASSNVAKKILIRLNSGDKVKIKFNESIPNIELMYVFVVPANKIDPKPIIHIGKNSEPKTD